MTTPQTPDEKRHYIALKKGEIIQVGDQWYSPAIGGPACWFECTSLEIGKAAGPTPHRRPELREKRGLPPEEESVRDWTEDFSHENGKYQSVCFKCGLVFQGHKRRVFCKLCDAVMSQPDSQRQEETEICPNCKNALKAGTTHDHPLEGYVCNPPPQQASEQTGEGFSEYRKANQQWWWWTEYGCKRVWIDAQAASLIDKQSAERKLEEAQQQIKALIDANDKAGFSHVKTQIRFDKMECTGCRGEGIVGHMTREGGEAEECPFCKGCTVDQLVDQIKTLTEERDAYQSGCESSKRGENEWHRKWELNQTEKINLRFQLKTVESSRDEAVRALKDASNISPNERSGILTHIEQMTTPLQREEMGIDGRPLHLQVLRILSFLNTCQSWNKKFMKVVCDTIYNLERPNEKHSMKSIISNLKSALKP